MRCVDCPEIAAPTVPRECCLKRQSSAVLIVDDPRRYIREAVRQVNGDLDYTPRNRHERRKAAALSNRS